MSLQTQDPSPSRIGQMIGFLSIVRYPMHFTFIDCVLLCDASNFRVSMKQLSQNTGGGRSQILGHCVAFAAALHLEKRTWRQLPPLTSARLVPTDERLKQDGKKWKNNYWDYIASSPGRGGPTSASERLSGAGALHVFYFWHPSLPFFHSLFFAGTPRVSPQGSLRV